VRLEPANVAWDLSASPGSEAVMQRLIDNEPDMPAALRRLHKDVPIARTCASFVAEPYSRPFEHRRCFYYSFDSLARLELLLGSILLGQAPPRGEIWV
jgi:hypothetical protein